MKMKSRFKSLSVLLVGTLSLAQCDKIPKFGESAEETEESGEAVVRDLEPTEFDAFIGIKDKLVVVDFHAEWCGPCRTLGPKLKAIAGEFGSHVVVGKINVDNAQQLAARLGVSGIPDVRIFRNGTQVDRFVGDIPASEIRKKMEAHAPAAGGEVGEGGEGEEAPAVEPIQPMTKDWIPEGMQKR